MCKNKAEFARVLCTLRKDECIFVSLDEYPYGHRAVRDLRCRELRVRVGCRPPAGSPNDFQPLPPGADKDPRRTGTMVWLVGAPAAPAGEADSGPPGPSEGLAKPTALSGGN